MLGIILCAEDTLENRSNGALIFVELCSNRRQTNKQIYSTMLDIGMHDEEK